MTRRRRIPALLAATLLVAVGTGCANDNTPEAHPTSSDAPASSPGPTGTTPAPSESEAAGQAASSVLRRHYEIVDQIRQDPKHPITALDQVVTGSLFVSEKGLLASERDQGYRQQGDTRVAAIKVNSVDLDNSDPKAGKVPTVSIDLCWDLSEIDMVDGQGRSVVANRPDRGWTRFSVSNYQWDQDPSGGWRIVSGDLLDKAPCPAS